MPVPRVGRQVLKCDPALYFFSFEYNFIYLFWAVAGSSLLHGLFSTVCNGSARASYCGGFYCFGARALWHGIQ